MIVSSPLQLADQPNGKHSGGIEEKNQNECNLPVHNFINSISLQMAYNFSFESIHVQKALSLSLWTTWQLVEMDKITIKMANDKKEKSSRSYTNVCWHTISRRLHIWEIENRQHVPSTARP